MSLTTCPDCSGRVVPVDLGENSYPIYIGSGTLSQLGQTIRFHCNPRLAVVVSDDTVAGLYAEAVEASLTAAGIDSHRLVVPPGESSKSLTRVAELYDRLFDWAVERSDVVIALGGGVVGDLAGFVAATFKRGVSYVQVPTSLLAMVDSSIGGKTGVNHARGKNMIGAFYQPKLVFTDIAVLGTLAPRELGCGLAESVKHGVIRDAAFFDFLESYSQGILALESEPMESLVERNCRIKAAVVADDERESGLRGILNLGHTVGHVLETVLKDRDIHHGEAVAIGMVAAGQLALERELLTDAQRERMVALLGAFRLPVSLKAPLPLDELYAAMLQDKKVKAGRIRFVLPNGIGDCLFADDIDAEAVKRVMQGLVES